MNSWLANVQKKLLSIIRSKIKYRLIAVFTVIYFIQLLCILFYYFFSTTAEKKEDYINQNVSLLQQVVENYDNSLRSINNTSLNIYREYEIMDEVSSLHVDSLQKVYELEKLLYETMERLYSINGSITSVFIYIDSLDRLYIREDTYISPGKDKFYYIEHPELSNEKWFASAEDYSKSIMRFSLNSDSKYINDAPHTFSLSCRVKDVFSGKNLLVLSINISDRFFQNIAGKVTGPNEDFSVISPDGSVIFSTDNFPPELPLSNQVRNSMQKYKSGYFDGEDKAGSRLYLYSTSDYSDWWLTKNITYENLNKKTKINIYTNILISILLGIPGLLLIVLTSIKITKPLETLSRVMEKDRAMDTSNLLDSKRADEIGQLERSFNSMVLKNNELVTKEFKAKLREKDARLKALQSQINPHFLFNTLQLISSMAIKEGSHTIETAIKSLSSMLRYSLSSRNSISTLGKELENIENYMLIQQSRFTQRLSIEIDIPEAYKQYSIPSLILQPIIENTVKHGFYSTTQVIKVRVYTQKTGNNMEIVVEDNGCGISTDRLEKIRTGIESDSLASKGYTDGKALSNINARLRYYYGDDAGLAIVSNTCSGTKVILTLPLKERQGGSDNV